MGILRREFLKGAAAAFAAAPIVRAAGDEPAIPIVDTHQHLWDLSKLRLPWLEGSKALNRSFLLDDYLEAARDLGVVKAIYMEVAVEASQCAAEAEHIIEICRSKKGPTCAAVIGGDPAAPGFAEYIGRFKGSPYIKGVRRIISGPAGAGISESSAGGIRLLGERGLSFDLCMPVERLAEGAALVERCPGTRFIVDHCGNADPKAFRPGNGEKPSHDPEAWRRDMARLAKSKHTVCKISGIVARVPKEWSPSDLAPIVDHCLDVFGPDRVVFGSDWPVCTRGAPLRAWVEALRSIVRRRSETDRRKLFHDNAVRIYGLR
ncbi:MAG: amidohydrolase family protein [Planctomycetes bacterium]|nr:amidohydrolase family protein [Planctomycetota bacterium]